MLRSLKSPSSFVFALLFTTLLASSCSFDSSSSGNSVTPKSPPPKEKINSELQMKKAIVVMISIDGFRADYMEKYKPVNLTKLANEGTFAADGMKPSFPSLTFPNHITLVTGKVPGHHGIVSNFFYDEKRKAAYQMNDDNAVHDGSWYRGEPLWTVAEKAGMLSATCFWVGSEATINNEDPTYLLPYSMAASMNSAQRAEKVIEWFQLPEDKKPHFISLYYSDVDSMGHAYGPDSDQVRIAIQDIDASIGTIVAYADKAKLPVQFVIVSDHGMLEVKGRINLGKLANLKDVTMMERGAVAQFYSDNDSYAEMAYLELKKKEDHFKVYRRGELPARFLFDDPDRSGDFTVVGDPGYYVTVEAAFTPPTARAAGASVATHGWDPEVPQMRALFIARGSMIKKGLKIPAFDNIHVYPLVLDLLDLKNQYPIDGRHEVLQNVLQ